MSCGPKHPSPFEPKDRLIIKNHLPPLTTRAGRADQDVHPGKVKARGGGGRSEEGMGAGINLLLAEDNRG